MSDLLGIGYSGLKAYSRALSTIGDNIANAQTPGYARRRLEMMEPVSGSDSVFYRGNVNPGGVEIRGVSRSVDAWLIEDSRISVGRFRTRGDQARLAGQGRGRAQRREQWHQDRADQAVHHRRSADL